MTDNGLEDAQMSQFEAPEKVAARYSSQAEPHSWPHCIMRRPITLVLLFAAILVINSMGVERGYRHLFTDKKTARYVCIRVCGTVYVGEGRRAASDSECGCSDPSRRQKLPLMTRPTTVVATFLPDVFILFVERTSTTTEGAGQRRNRIRFSDCVL
jgi:hypothetical protein